MKLLNDNILIRFKQKADELVTASGIILPLVEQDMNVAEVMAVPSNSRYETIQRQADGTPDRDDEGNPLVVENVIYVKVGDKVLMEKRFHHNYDWRKRDRIDHTCFLDGYTKEKNNGHDYYLTKNDDILCLWFEPETKAGNVYGELFSQIPVKPVTQR